MSEVSPHKIGPNWPIRPCSFAQLPKTCTVSLCFFQATQPGHSKPVFEEKIRERLASIKLELQEDIRKHFPGATAKERGRVLRMLVRKVQKQIMKQIRRTSYEQDELFIRML